jgi:hypothetical protein
MIEHRMRYYQGHSGWMVWCDTCKSTPLSKPDETTTLTYVMEHSSQRVIPQETSGTMEYMRCEWYGGPRDGEVFDIHPDVRQVEWTEGSWYISDPDQPAQITYRAPVAPEFQGGQPTGKALIYYRYRHQVHTADDLS